MKNIDDYKKIVYDAVQHEYNWSTLEETSFKTSERAKTNLLTFIDEYISKLLNDGFEIVLPNVTPSENGDLSTWWVSKNYELLMTFNTEKESRFIASYYGDDGKSNDIVEGKLESIYPLKKHLLVWMQNLSI
jgi:hypothetical protein